jgi:hypothetical protein
MPSARLTPRYETASSPAFLQAPGLAHPAPPPLPPRRAAASGPQSKTTGHLQACPPTARHEPLLAQEWQLRTPRLVGGALPPPTAQPLGPVARESPPTERAERRRAKKSGR